MRELRILLTCIGRRVELVQAFRSAAENLSITLTLYGADISDSAPALFFCDRNVKSPKISDPAYISELLAICRQEKIDCLIPTIDTDLLLLSKNKDMFNVSGTQLLVSAEDMIKICRDKRLTSTFFVECGLLAPMPVDTIAMYKSGFPAFIKPVNGSSSINAFKVYSQEDLESRASQVFDYIIQPFIEGTEYTVDIFCDFEGRPVLITPRERIAVRSGEVLKTRICQDEVIIAECMKIVKLFKPCGPLTVQLIRQKDIGKDYYIEINPRFGGGAPLSMKAGADSAKALLQLLIGRGLNYSSKAAKDGTVFSRFDQSVCTHSAYTFDYLGSVKAVIFDLDDTLYSEKDYIRSGFKAVAEKIDYLVDDAFNKLWTAFEAGKPAIDIVLSAVGEQSLRDECLDLYRSHMPDITLYPGVFEMLASLRHAGFKLGVITDGRPKGQRAKIEALGLADLVDSIIITDELGGTTFRKPCDIAFRIMQRRLGVPYDNMVYVGDNIEKDFDAPRQLGMKSMWLRNPEGLYYHNTADNQSNVIIVDSLSDMYSMLFKTENFGGGG